MQRRLLYYSSRLFRGKLLPFFASPYFSVTRRATKENLRVPHIKVTADDCDIICLKLAKKGYKGGDPEAIESMSLSWVLKMIQYEDFCQDYEEEYYNLNRDNG